MRIEAIRLKNIRRFGEEGVQVDGLTAGLNVLAAPNESGKSTVVDALHACLTVPHTHRKPVESLVPATGGSPWIELDLVTADGAFRVEKRFLTEKLAKITDRNGRIVAQAGDADEWLRTAIGSGTKGEGPIGLVWVRQDASTEVPITGGARGETLRDLVGEQVGEIVGGQMTQRVARATCERLSGYLTERTSRIAKQGPLGKIQERVAELENRVKTLRGRTDLTRSRAEQLAEVRDELERLENAADVARLKASFEDAEAAHGEAVRRNAALEGERSKASGAIERLEAAKGKLEALMKEQAAAADADEALELAERSARKAETEREARDGKATAAKATSDEAERALGVAGKAAVEARRRADASRAREELDRAERQLADAQSASKALAALPPPRAAIDLEGLRTLRDEVTRARAQAEAARATIRIEAAAGLVVDGREARAGETVTVDRAVSLAAGESRIVVEPPRVGGTEPQTALERAERDLAAALTKAGAADLREAESRAKAGADRDQEALQHQKVLDRVVPEGIAALETTVRVLGTKAAEASADGPSDVAGAEATRADAEERAATARGVVDQASAAAAEARATAVGASANLDAARRRAEEGAERAGPLEERVERLSSARQIVETADAEATAARTGLEAAEAGLPDLGAAEDRVTALKENRENRTRKVKELHERRGGLGEAVRSDHEGDAAETLARTEDELEAVREEETRERIELEALQLLEATLATAHADRLERFLTPVTAELAPLVDVVLPGAALNLDGELALASLRRGDREEALDVLSGGTREQLAILAKLAFARLLAKGGHPVPVVMDDALVFADDERLERMFRAVRMAAADTQVIALTCRVGAHESLGGNAVGLRPL